MLRTYRAPRPLLCVGLSSAILGCRVDDTITKFNAEPEATLVTPVNGSVFEVGQPVELSGRGSDPDDDATTLSATWFVNAVPTCDTAVSGAGDTACTWIATEGSSLVELLITDPGGASATASSTILVSANLPPDLRMISPIDGDSFSLDAPIAVEATVADDRDTPTELSFGWQVDGVELDPSATVDDRGVITAYLDPTSGDHVLVLTAIDTDGGEASASVSFSIAGPETPPECGFITTDGASAVGASASFSATVSDIQTASDALSLVWTSDLDGTFGTGGADSEGNATVTTSTLSPGTHQIGLTATDEAGLTCTDQLQWRVVEPPEVVIELPLDGSVVGEGDHVDLVGSVVDAEDAATSLTLTWESDVDGLLDGTPADSSGRAAASVDDLSVGTHVVTLTALDSDGMYTTAGITLTVDGRPGAPGVTLSPSGPGTDDELTASITSESVDPEGAAVRYRYEWYQDGALSGASSTAALPATATTRGESWRVDVYPSDGVYEGAPGEATVTIGNTVPSLSSAVCAGEGGATDAAEADTLTCTAGTTADADGGPVTLRYAWEVDGVVVSGAVETRLAGAFTSGSAVVCVVTPDDGVDAGLPVTSNIMVIGNTAPVATAVVLAPGAPGTDDLVTASPTGADVDGDALTWSYAWYVDGVLLPATGASLDGASWFDRGDTIEVDATPDDGHTTGPSVRSASVTVVNTAPALTGVTLGPSPADETSVLSCVADSPPDAPPDGPTDADGDTVSLSYTWEVSGTTLGTTGATLTGADFDRGDTVRCTVTPSDGFVSGAAVTSATLVISNAAPGGATATLAPSPVRTEDLLTATAAATDADGDAITWTWEWYREGTRLSVTTNTLDGASYFAKGQTIVVIATPSDSSGVGAAATASITVANTAPSVAAATVTPGSPHETDNVTCFNGPTSDDDRDSVSIAYAWEVNGVRNTVTTDTLTGASYSKGDTVQCFLTPNDGTEDGAELASNVATVLNSTPTATAVSLSPTNPGTDDVLTATATAVDDDGDALTWSYVWYRDGARQSATGATLNGAVWFAKGQTIEVVVTPTDGTTAGPTARSGIVTVVNTPPGAPTVEIQPADPIEAEDDLRCVVTTPASDADGDAVSYGATWDVDGVAFVGTTTTFAGDSVSADDIFAEQEWTCLVTATDSSAATATANDTVVILGNPVNYAQLQYPCSGSVAAGANFDVYAWIYEPAVTQGPGQGLGIDVEIGVGPDATEPASASGWTWFPAVYNTDKDGPYPGDEANDEYLGTLTAPATAGEYDYAARATTDHGLSYVFIDLGGDTCHYIGTSDGYEPTTAGALTVY